MSTAVATAVVIGAGTGITSRALAVNHEVLTIAFPGESVQGLPGHVYVCDSAQSASLVVAKAFSSHARIARLPSTVFYDRHDIAPELERLRTAFAAEFYNLLCRRPMDFGDDIMDGLQGAYHLALGAKRLLSAPMPHEVPRATCPAIAVAAGPSLATHLDALRALQERCIIISCDATLEGLLRAGIRPHYVTPLERVRAIVDDSFPSPRYDGVVFAGVPAVHQDIPAKFDRHLFLPGTDLLYLWAGARQEHLMHFGQSTGTLAVALGLVLTSGPVYLVGHDLAFADGQSHWADVPDAITIAQKETFEVDGHAGRVTTQYWWDVFRREIADFARQSGRVVNVNAVTGVGARIEHAIAAPLPVAADLPPYERPEIGTPYQERLRAFQDSARFLVRDAQGIIARLNTRRLLDLADMDMRRLCPGPNRPFFSYILRSTLAQFSMELNSGKEERVVLPAMAHAVRQALKAMLPMITDMQEAVCDA